MATPTVTRRIAQSAGIVMASVLVSRVLGFCREWAVAHEIGSNAITDAYYAAFTLPDFLNYLVAGGSLSLTFIPVFARYVSEDREEEGWRVFSIVITVMSIVLLALVLLAEIFVARLVSWIAPGFDPALQSLVVSLTRLMLPAQACFYLGSILSAVQYAKARFVLPSLAPVIYNLGVILFGVLLSSRLGITAFAVGVLAGATAGNLLLQVYGAWRAGARFGPNFNVRHPGFCLFLKLSIPIMLALSLVFTDDWIIRWFGSHLERASITWLTYAKTLMRVPLGIVGQAVGVAAFPFLSQLYSEGKLEEFNRTLNSMLKGLILLLVPVSALTIAQSRPLVYFVFSHTRLRPQDLEATAATLDFFSLGMFAWGVQNILARGFYAARDTLTPAALGTVCTVFNLPVYWVLARYGRHEGLAVASSCGIIGYTLLLFVVLNRRIRNPEARSLSLFFLKVGSASTAAALASFGLLRALETQLRWQSLPSAFVVLVMVSAAGLFLAAFLARILGVRELDPYLRKLGFR